MRVIQSKPHLETIKRVKTSTDPNRSSKKIGWSMTCPTTGGPHRFSPKRLHVKLVRISLVRHVEMINMNVSHILLTATNSNPWRHNQRPSNLSKGGCPAQKDPPLLHVSFRPTPAFSSYRLTGVALTEASCCIHQSHCLTVQRS